jgi:hypothetical protein
MATYKILSCQEVPSQIKVEDETDDITVRMPDSFQERIDPMAARRGLQESDASVRAELEAKADW